MGNNRLSNLNVNISDAVFLKKRLAPRGHDDTIIGRERRRHHTDPEDGRGIVLFRVPNADYINASPFHLHRVQKGKDLGSQVAFSDLFNWMAVSKVELLELPVCLWAGGHLPRSCACASNQDRGRRQASIVELGLHLGRRGWECTGRVLWRGDTSHGVGTSEAKA